jgi:hypothetical protein
LTALADPPHKPDGWPDPIREPGNPNETGRPAGAAPSELERSLQMQKELTENLKEVIQARDLEIKYLQNTIAVQERLLQNYPNDRVFGAIYDLYLRFNELFPSGTRRRRLMGRLVDLLARR